MPERLYSPDRPSPKTLDDQRRWSQAEFDRLSAALERIAQQLENLDARVTVLEPP